MNHDLKFLHLQCLVSYTNSSSFFLFFFFFFGSGMCLVQEMLQYPVLTLTRKLLIGLGACYVVIGVFLFSDSEVFAILEDIKGKVGS